MAGVLQAKAVMGRRTVSRVQSCASEVSKVMAVRRRLLFMMMIGVRLGTMVEVMMMTRMMLRMLKSLGLTLASS